VSFSSGRRGPLPLGDERFRLAAAVGVQRLPDIHLLPGELALLAAAGVTLVAFMRLNDFSFTH